MLELSNKNLKFYQSKRIEPNLVGFKGVLAWNYQVEDQMMKFLAKMLKVENRTKKVNIDLHEFINIFGKGMSFLFESLPKLDCLKSLEMRMDGCCVVTDIFLGNLGKALGRCSTLRRISLSFESCSPITDIGVENLIKGLKRLSLLEKVSLNFSGCQKLTNITLKRLVKRLWSSATEIHLNFDDCQGITGMGLKNLSQALKTTLNLRLKGVELIFRGCVVKNDLELYLLNQAFTKFTWLRRLGLNFLEYPKIIAVGSAFSLAFDSSQEVNDHGLNLICQSLKNAAGLRSINFGFLRCRGLTNSGIEGFGKALKTLCDLRTISLNFKECVEISHVGVQILCESLMSLGLLRSVILNFMNCRKIDMKELESLVEIFGKALCLENLDMIFVGCENVKSETREKLMKGLGAREKKVNIVVI